MRKLVHIVLVFFSLSSLGDEFFRFSTTEFAFRKNYPIFVFDIAKAESSKKVRVCCASVKSNTTDSVTLGVALAEDMRDCSAVDSFGRHEGAFVRRVVLEGKTALYNPTGSEEEQVRIKGKLWSMSDNAKAIVTRVDSDSGDEGGLNYICRFEMRPLDRIYEETAPVRNLFCKPIKPIEVQMADLEDKLLFDANHNPIMIETVVCPLPANCIKPEWAIEPTMRFIPEEAAGTAHALEKTPAVVHKDQRPSTRD